MLPDDHRSTFIQIYADAFRLGREGRATLGFVILEEALGEAEQGRRHGAFWGEEVVGLYRDAVRDYVRCFGLPEPWPPPSPERAGEVLATLVLSGRIAEIADRT
jgi:hypothetical protein